MIRTIDVLFNGKSFVLAFRSEEDAWRFILFMQEHERECRDPDPDAVYRLDPQWSIGQYGHVPAYAVWRIDPQAVLRMLIGLMDARLGADGVPPQWPNISLTPSKKEGISFSIDDMPQPLSVN